MDPPIWVSRNFTHEECASVVALQEEGFTATYLAQRLHVADSTISRVLSRFRETGCHERRSGKSRKRITTARENRFIRLQSLRQRFLTSTYLQQQFVMTYGRRLSQDTVRRRLAEVDLRPYQAAKVPLLTREHRRERLKFAEEHLNWNNADWGRVMFSDDSRFSLYIWRKIQPGVHSWDCAIWWWLCHDMGRHHFASKNRVGTH
jgi:transposase